MSLGLVVLEKKLFTRTPTPQSDDIKITMHSKEKEMQNILFNLNNFPICELCMDFNAIKMAYDIICVIN